MTTHTDTIASPVTRALAPSDYRAIADLHARLAPDMVLSRYLTPHPDLSQERLADLLDVDGYERAAVVVESPAGQVVALARWARRAGSDLADVVVIADEAGRASGAERLALEALAAEAAAQGLGRLAIEVLPIDRAFLDLVASSALKSSRHLHCGVVTVTIDLVGLDLGVGREDTP
jgi:hypothetical protein